VRILVISDVHGRGNWTRAVTLPDIDKIVFLGDYLDQSHDSGISNQQCLDNFCEIVSFASSDDRVHLLLGNHDFHYLEKGIKYQGYRSSLNFQFLQFYLSNKQLFSFYLSLKDGDKTPVIFTHAGVVPHWLQLALDEFCRFIQQPEILINNTNLIESIDSVFNLPKHRLFPLLDRAVACRGGVSPSGSPIWADASELLNWSSLEDNLGDFIQVVGHNQVPEITSVFSGQNRGILFTDCCNTVDEHAVIDLSSTFKWSKV